MKKNTNPWEEISLLDYERHMSLDSVKQLQTLNQIMKRQFSTYHWISVIRLPDFVTKKDFAWAVQTASVKKKMDCSSAEFLELTEGCHPRRQKNDKVNSQLTLQLLWSNMYQNDISN